MHIKYPICFAAGDDAIDTATAMICFRIGYTYFQSYGFKFNFIKRERQNILIILILITILNINCICIYIKILIINYGNYITPFYVSN